MLSEIYLDSIKSKNSKKKSSKGYPLIAESAFKEQLLEFVENREDPFNLSYLMMNCNQTLDKKYFQNAIYELEEEGQIIQIDHNYLSAKILMRRWIQPLEKLEDYLTLPSSLVHQVQELIEEKYERGYNNIDDFIIDAVKLFIQHLKKALKR